MDELITIVEKQAKVITELQNQLYTVINRLVSVENDLQKVEENLGVTK